MKVNPILNRFVMNLLIAVAVGAALLDFQSAFARPVGKKGGSASPLSYRQRNTYSNIDFFFTNKGVLFNNDAVAGCNWPRGTTNSYIFGGGMWFATKKSIGGKKRKLC